MLKNRQEMFNVTSTADFHQRAVSLIGYFSFLNAHAVGAIIIEIVHLKCHSNLQKSLKGHHLK